METKEMQGLSLPSLEQSRRRGVHFMAETPDGQGLSVRENELSAFLRKYGQPAETPNASESLGDSGSRP